MKTIYPVNILKAILLFALLNSSLYLIFVPDGILRLIIAAGMNISGCLLVIYFLYYILTKRFSSNLYFKVVFMLLIIWSLITNLRGLSFDISDNISLFGHYLMSWAWITPLSIVFGFNILNWTNLFSFIRNILILGSLITICFVFFFPSFAIGLSELLILFPILLLTYFYQRKRIRLVVYLSILTLLILSYFSSQRANLLFLGLSLGFYISEYYRQPLIVFLRKIMLSLKLVIIAISLLLVVSYNFKMIFNETLLQDTRSFLAVELFLDTSEQERIIGRGVLGTYYSPYFKNWNKTNEGGDSPTRSVNEIGYLHMLLKGGYIMIGLYLLILLPAAFLGIARSSNIIARMSGYFILLYIFLWLISYYPVYSAEYILLWMAAGTCISPQVRKIPNSEILIKRNGRYVFR
ncbi:hypothetical protein OAK24_00935 [Flavobacteriales bacterium]|nr:hypothetical protein [Flavobacteriales bacterium]